MKITFDKEKSTEALRKIAQSSAEFGAKAAVSVKDSALSFAEKAKDDSYARRMKKYNPLFPEQYFNDSFFVPNIIVIVDDAVRRGIDVCEGAIGWLGKEGGMEVLYLYDEAISECGLEFVPAPACDNIYYMDGFDRKRFVRTDYIFGKAHEERLAELKHIANCLGAKRCTVEISETAKEVKSKKKKADSEEKLHGLSVSQSASLDSDSHSSAHITGKITAEYEGNSIPVKPKLKWFAHDENILRLVDMRCEGNNAVKSETIELSGSTCSTMSLSAACSIDAAVQKMKLANASTSLNVQAEKEHHTKLLFHIEF